jgi:hypothetical protein
VPASTARGWLNKPAIEVVSLDVLDLDTMRLQREVMQLRRRVTKLTALLRLAIVIVRVTGFSFHRIRIADGDDKQRLLSAIGRTRSQVGVRMVRAAVESTTNCSKPTVCVDGGVENFNPAVDEVIESGILKRVTVELGL